MIVIGVDVHKHSLSAVAVDEVGRQLGRAGDELTTRVGRWAKRLAASGCGRWRTAARDARAGADAAAASAAAGAGAAAVDGPRAATRPGAGQVGPDRRARHRESRAAGAEARLSRGRGGAAARAEAVGRPPRRPRRRATSLPAAAALAPARARPDPQGAARRARPRRLARPYGRKLAAANRRPRCGSHASCSTAAAASPARSRARARTASQARQRLAPRLLELPGCGPFSAAKLLCEIGPIDRFRSDAQLARHAGVAPLDASSGKHQRHRLDRGGNRQLNCALHRIAVTQGRVHPPAKAYLERKQAEGKSRREALRCLKRQLARTVYTTLKNTGPGDLRLTKARLRITSGGHYRTLAQASGL